MSVHRLRRRGLPRYLIRIFLGGAALVWVVITLAPRVEQGTETLLIAKGVLTAGQLVSASDFESQNVQLGSHTELYLRPTDLKPGLVMVRDASPGEFVPVTAIRPRDFDLVPLALQLDQPISKLVKPGARVSLWVSPQKFSERDAAEQIASDVKVADLQVSESMNRVSTRIEVWVKLAFVPSVLLAQSDGSAISVVLEPSLEDAR